MKPFPGTIGDAVTLVVRVVVGGVFLFSSAVKILDPAAFASIVANYQLLPSQLVWATAVFLPWLEATCGLALIFGRCEKGAAMLVSLMMVLFISLIFYNGYRGLDIACGCFSLAAKAPANIVVNTLRNLLILAGGTWVLLFPRPQRVTISR